MPRIFILDDDEECLRGLEVRLRFAFRHVHLVVDTADCASKACILASQHHYDCMIVDVVIPGVNGIKFLEQLRERQIEVPVILMSGRELDDPEAAQRHRLYAFLPKPLDFNILRSVVASALGLEGTLEAGYRSGNVRHFRTASGPNDTDL